MTQEFMLPKEKTTPSLEERVKSLEDKISLLESNNSHLFGYSVEEEQEELVTEDLQKGE